MLKSKKHLFGLIAVLTICCSFTLFVPCKKHSISGTAMRAKSYCGGARMSEERYAEYTKAKAFANKKLFIKKGKYNDFNKKAVVEVVTDSSGNFSLSLPAGIYCIVDEYKKEKANYTSLLNQYKSETKNYSAISETCLQEWFKTPDLVFEVKKVTDKITVTFQDKCSWNKIPCVTYKGPLPQ